MADMNSEHHQVPLRDLNSIVMTPPNGTSPSEQDGHGHVVHADFCKKRFCVTRRLDYKDRILAVVIGVLHLSLFIGFMLLTLQYMSRAIDERKKSVYLGSMVLLIVVFLHTGGCAIHWIYVFWSGSSIYRWLIVHGVSICAEVVLYYFSYEWPLWHNGNPFEGPHLEVFASIVVVEFIQVIASIWLTVVNNEELYMRAVQRLPEAVRPQPLRFSSEFKSKRRTVPVTEVPVGRECSICLGELKEGDTVERFDSVNNADGPKDEANATAGEVQHDDKKVIKLSCKHMFHEACIKQWGEIRYRDGEPFSCPECREQVLKRGLVYADLPRTNAIYVFYY